MVRSTFKAVLIDSRSGLELGNSGRIEMLSVSRGLDPQKSAVHRNLLIKPNSAVHHRGHRDHRGKLFILLEIRKIKGL